MEKIISEIEAKELIMSTKGSIFGVQFVKKDKSLRDMTCRLGVKKHLKGGVNTCAGYTQYVNVFEMTGAGEVKYRNVNVKTLLTVKVAGQVFVVNHI